MRIKQVICLSTLLMVLLALGGCGATGKNNPQPVSKIKTSTEKQMVASLIARTKNIKGYSYQYTIDINGDKKTGKAWASTDKQRAETVIDGQKVITIYDRKNEIVYSYYPQRKEAVKMPAEDTPDLVAAPEEYLQGILDDRINLLGDTKYRGVPCRLILAQDPQSQAHIKLWVRTDWGFPLRVESTDPDGNSCVVEYTNMQVASQASSLFRLPAGTKVIDLAKMMKQTQ